MSHSNAKASRPGFLRNALRHPGSLLLSAVTHLGALITVLVLGFLLAYILINGIPNLKPELFSPVYTSENQSMLPAIINTCTMTLVSLLLAVPFHLPGGICPQGQQAGGPGARDDGDPLGHPVDCLWSVWYAVF